MFNNGHRNVLMDFRSLLPHEPPPIHQKGYISLQGIYILRAKSPENPFNFDEIRCEHETFFVDALRHILPFPHTDIQFIGDNKIILEFEKFSHGFWVTRWLKTSKKSFYDIFMDYFTLLNNNNDNNNNDNNNNAKNGIAENFLDVLERVDKDIVGPSQKTIQATQMVPLNEDIMGANDITCSDSCWPRVSPPKFRRILRSDPKLSEEQYQRDIAETRFVFLSGVGSQFASSFVNKLHINCNELTTLAKEDQQVYNLLLTEVLRQKILKYDSTGQGIEVWVGRNYVYLGMRTNEDARRTILDLQGQQLDFSDLSNFCFLNEYSFKEKEVEERCALVTERLFLDWAAITLRSKAKTNRPLRGPWTDVEEEKGEPTKSECTSLTKDVIVPGLYVYENFISEDEEAVILATLTGPTATWFERQDCPSGGKVKRRVQHYGYIFDYLSADVLRNPSSDEESATFCPPLPSIPSAYTDDLQNYIDHCSYERKGWELLGGTIEKVRRTNFCSTQEDHYLFPDINQMTVNEYLPGQGIGSHVDTHHAFSDGIFSLTLGSGIVMEFRSVDNNQMKKLVYLPPRSLLLMSGDARYKWEHMIVTRMTDTVDGGIVPRGKRVSLTLRTALTLGDAPRPLPRIESSYVLDQETSSSPARDTTDYTDDSVTTPECERKNVHAVYDAIAEQWHHTRGKRGILWPKATEFLESIPKGSIVADVGCGDGKYFAAGWAAGSYVIGSDISLPLLKTAMGGTDGGKDLKQVAYDESGASKRPAVAVGDCLNVPLRDKSCDGAICIAVMHHLSTVNRRLKCLSELKRIVKVGGLINVQAWAMEQEEGSKRKFAGSDIFVPFNAQPKYLVKVAESKTCDGINDDTTVNRGNDSKGAADLYAEAYEGAELDQKKGLVVFQRYCHVYRSGELDELVHRVGGLKIHESGFEKGNHYVVLEVIE